MTAPAATTPTPRQRARHRKRPCRRTHVVVPIEWALDADVSLPARAVLVAALALAYTWSEMSPAPVPVGELTPFAGDVGDLRSLLAESVAAGYVEVDSTDCVRFVPPQWPAQPAGMPPVPEGNVIRRPLTDTSVVYYLSRADAAVKVGFSDDLAQRIVNLSRKHGKLALLGTEPGGWDLEQKRHQQFAEHRIKPRAEWFRPGATLLAHVETLGDKR